MPVIGTQIQTSIKAAPVTAHTAKPPLAKSSYIKW